MSLSDQDARALARAFELAARGIGEVEPNPPVGAVLHERGTILGEGWHRAYGEPHAEDEALRMVTNVPAGATLAVSLEPCSTPAGPGKKRRACTELLLERGVRRLVIGQLDPDARHGGRGVAMLRERGVDVQLAPPGSGGSTMLDPFRAHLSRTRPYVLLKWACEFDGSWVPHDKTTRWISCEESRQRVHELRSHVDGILVGAGTVLKDDPLLTARTSGPLRPVRIVVDARARVSVRARVFSTPEDGPILWMTAREPAVEAPRGVTRVPLERPHAIADQLLPELKRRGVARLLVEGGPTTAAAFLEEGVVDRAWVFVAPRIRGGDSEAQTALRAAEAALPSDLQENVDSVERSGCDAWFKLSF